MQSNQHLDGMLKPVFRTPIKNGTEHTLQDLTMSLKWKVYLKCDTFFCDIRKMQQWNLKHKWNIKFLLNNDFAHYYYYQSLNA
jgi:hypothetical protein